MTAADAPDLAFFEVAAQVIPLMLLTLVVELRVFRTPPDAEPNTDGERTERARDALVALVTITSLLLGEIAALVALKRADPVVAETILVVAALGAGGIVIATSLLRPWLVELQRILPARRATAERAETVAREVAGAAAASALFAAVAALLSSVIELVK